MSLDELFKPNKDDQNYQDARWLIEHGFKPAGCGVIDEPAYPGNWEYDKVEDGEVKYSISMELVNDPDKGVWCGTFWEDTNDGLVEGGERWGDTPEQVLTDLMNCCDLSSKFSTIGDDDD